MLEFLVGSLVLYFGYHFFQGYLKAGKLQPKRERTQGMAPKPALPSHGETPDQPLTDSERLQKAPEQAFEWVAKEIDGLSRQEHAALCAAWTETRNAGWSAATRRMLEAAWPAHARWRSAEEYLRTLGWRPAHEIGDEEDDEYDGPDLMELLYWRLTHVSGRMYRDPQVRALIDPASPNRSKKYTAVTVNRHGLHTRRTDPCGIGRNKQMSIGEGMELMRTPAHAHPACRCTVDPHPV